jgi:hypothetical protein
MFVIRLVEGLAQPGLVGGLASGVLRRVSAGIAGTARAEVVACLGIRVGKVPQSPTAYAKSSPFPSSLPATAIPAASAAPAISAISMKTSRRLDIVPPRS